MRLRMQDSHVGGRVGEEAEDGDVHVGEMGQNGAVCVTKTRDRGGEMEVSLVDNTRRYHKSFSLFIGFFFRGPRILVITGAFLVGWEEEGP